MVQGRRRSDNEAKAGENCQRKDPVIALGSSAHAVMPSSRSCSFDITEEA